MNDQLQGLKSQRTVRCVGKVVREKVEMERCPGERRDFILGTERTGHIHSQQKRFKNRDMKESRDYRREIFGKE